MMRCGKNLCSFERNIELNGSEVYIKQTLDLTGTFTVSYTCTNIVTNRPKAALLYIVLDGVTKYIDYADDGRVRTYTGHITEIGILNYGSATGTINTIQLELGSTATPYEPYISQTNTLTLPETVYGGEVDAVSGEVAEAWGLVTFDGTETWVVSGKYLDDKTDWYYLSSKIPNAVDEFPRKGNEICSHYPHADVANNNTVQGCAIVWGAIRVRWGDTIPDDANAWKAYLAAQNAAGTPVQVAYKLAEPVPFTATGAQSITALAGTNTILTDTDSATVTGRADLIKIITDLQATQAISDVERAVTDI